MEQSPSPGKAWIGLATVPEHFLAVATAAAAVLTALDHRKDCYSVVVAAAAAVTAGWLYFQDFQTAHPLVGYFAADFVSGQTVHLPAGP